MQNMRKTDMPRDDANAPMETTPIEGNPSHPGALKSSDPISFRAADLRADQNRSRCD